MENLALPSYCPHEKLWENDAKVKAELEQAGIPHETWEPLRESNGETKTAVIGTCCGWIFKRAWYYYIAEGNGIPPDKAEEFHKTWGKEVRVEGNCTCPSPLKYNKGFAIGTYHIDTQEGLNAFVQLLKSIYTGEKT